VLNITFGLRVCVQHPPWTNCVCFRPPPIRMSLCPTSQSHELVPNIRLASPPRFTHSFLFFWVLVFVFWRVFISCTRTCSRSLALDRSCVAFHVSQPSTCLISLPRVLFFYMSHPSTCPILPLICILPRVLPFHMFYPPTCLVLPRDYLSCLYQIGPHRGLGRPVAAMGRTPTGRSATWTPTPSSGLVTSPMLFA
jgi:hypothetical protein